MPSYTITHRLFALVRGYTVRDETGAVKFRIAGRLAFPRIFSVKDASGTALLRAREKLWVLRPTFVIRREGTTVATVVRETPSHATHPRYAITTDLDSPMEAHGRLSYEDEGVKVTRDGTPLATIWRVQRVLRETFRLETTSFPDQALLVAITMSMAEMVWNRGESTG